MTSLAAASSGRIPDDGLGAVIRRTEPGFSSRTWDRQCDGPVVRAADLALAKLVDWLRAALKRPRKADAGVPPPAGLEGLIGLGPGLTPSGDDLLGGVLIALRGLGRGRAAGVLGRWVLSRARTRTNVISYALLAAAVRGEGSEALHEMLALLWRPGTPGLRERLDKIAAIGHTSGWDALAGAMLVYSQYLEEAQLPGRGG
jgi:hypothetical protein